MINAPMTCLILKRLHKSLMVGRETSLQNKTNSKFTKLIHVNKKQTTTEFKKLILSQFTWPWIDYTKVWWSDVKQAFKQTKKQTRPGLVLGLRPDFDQFR